MGLSFEDKESFMDTTKLESLCFDNPPSDPGIDQIQSNLDNQEEKEVATEPITT